eukprot:598040-Alexandrium_andersonii.AAC.1
MARSFAGFAILNATCKRRGLRSSALIRVSSSSRRTSLLATLRGLLGSRSTILVRSSLSASNRPFGAPLPTPRALTAGDQENCRTCLWSLASGCASCRMA